jgi:uncharacterized protein YciI
MLYNKTQETNMQNFMIAYYGGKQPTSKEEGMAMRGKWKQWIENLGETIVNSGTPLLDSKIITSTSVQDDNSPDSMNGFAVIKAENMETAIKIAKTDPFLESGGTVRVSQMMEMK